MQVLESEIADKSEVIAVKEMLNDDFKELMKDKYLYSSSDEVSDYDSDEENRERNRQIFRFRKHEKRLANIIAEKRINRLDCKDCEFVAKSASGLKIHITKKHGVVAAFEAQCAPKIS